MGATGNGILGGGGRLCKMARFIEAVGLLQQPCPFADFRLLLLFSDVDEVEDEENVTVVALLLVPLQQSHTTATVTNVNTQAITTAMMILGASPSGENFTSKIHSLSKH